MAKTTKQANYERVWHIVATLRIMLGYIFLWAFLDKTIGLGFSTKMQHAWVNGVSPTNGFLSHAQGPFADFFHSLAGSVFVDWVFMLAVLGMGIALIFGIGLRLAAVGGTVLLVMMWMASMPMTTNPLYDEHIVYAVMLWVFLFAPRKWSLYDRWVKYPTVKKNPWIQ